ncbi:MAG: LTA synthase family protein [Acidobacteriota bacterium]
MTRHTPTAFFLALLVQFAVVAALWAQGPWDVEVLEPGVPATLLTGETVVVRVTLSNRGTQGWDPASGFAVAAHWLTPDHDVVDWEGARTPLDEIVRPGASVTLKATLLAPQQAGDFLVQWDVVQEGVFWVAHRDPTPVDGAPVEVSRSHSFVQLDVSQPRLVRVGESETARLVLENNGTVEWVSDGTFGVAGSWRRFGWWRRDEKGARTYFDKPVKPGEEIEIEVLLKPPNSAGLWFLEWDLVQEGVCFFSQRTDQHPPATLMVVLPSYEGAVVGVSLIGLVFLLVFGKRRRIGPFRWVAGRLDLAWMVLVSFFVERSVVEGTFVGGVVTALSLCALAALVALAGRRARPWLAWSASLLMITVFVADRIYLRFFSDLPSIGSLSTMGQTDEVGQSIISLFTAGDVLFLLLGLAGGGAIVAARVINYELPPLRRRAAAATLLCMAAGIGLWWAAERPIHRQVFRRVFVARDIGVTAGHILDFARAAYHGLREKTVSNAEIDRLERWFRETADDRRGEGTTFGVARDMNVVMVQAESVQAFVVGLEIGGRLVMPHLTRWAMEGLWFTQAADQTGHGRSSDAELITQTSLLPLADGAAAFKTAANHYTSLAGILSDRGYQTISAVPFDRAFWNRGISHRAYGYETSLFSPDFEPGRKIGWGLNDRDFLGQMGDRLAELPRPFCAWMLTLSLHHPFEGFPDDLEELDVGRWGGGPVGEYLHTMHYLDKALGDLELESHREVFALFVADQEPVELLVVCPADEDAVLDGPFAVAHRMPSLERFSIHQRFEGRFLFGGSQGGGQKPQANGEEEADKQSSDAHRELLLGNKRREIGRNPGHRPKITTAAGRVKNSGRPAVC